MKSVFLKELIFNFYKPGHRAMEMQERRNALLCGHETKQLKQLEVKSKKMEWEEPRGRARARTHTQDLQEDYLCTFAKIKMQDSSSPPSSFMEMCVFPSNVVFSQQAKGGLRWERVPCSGGQGWDAEVRRASGMFFLARGASSTQLSGAAAACLC